MLNRQKIWRVLFWNNEPIWARAKNYRAIVLVERLNHAIKIKLSCLKAQSKKLIFDMQYIKTYKKLRKTKQNATNVIPFEE